MRKKFSFKMIRNILFFIGLIFLTFWLLFKDQDINEINSVIKSANGFFILIGIFVMLLYFLAESYNIKKLLKSFGENVSLISALKYTWIGFFFSAITPAATGGQPLEVYYMTKDKISGAKGTLIMLIQLCGFQISTISIGIICAIINFNLLQDGLIWLFLLGITINGFALFLMLVCIFSKKLTQKIVNVFLKLLKFFKVKNIEGKKQKINSEMEKYEESSIFIKSHKIEFAKAIFRVFIQILLYYSIPFFVYKAFGLNDYNLFNILTMQAVLYTIVSGLPLPGAVGISETVFLKIFEPVFGNELLSGAMLLSRGITFYLYVIISLLVVIINAIRTKSIVSEIDQNVIDLEEDEKRLIHV